MVNAKEATDALLVGWANSIFFLHIKICENLFHHTTIFFHSSCNHVFLNIFKKTVSDSNVRVQDKALDALIAYLKDVDADAGRYAKEECDAIMAKCLTGLSKTVEKAQMVFMLWVELEAVDVFLEQFKLAGKSFGGYLSSGGKLTLENCLKYLEKLPMWFPLREFQEPYGSGIQVVWLRFRSAS
ncbi:hypothetical protein L6452_42503 [Arctium lappa]|uniref:Uncharacterized protein n=1 Tax=Arctium lappa TaxID=4217 RepID=A0ACB8XHY7_ARCLA|nr:hypothetical protein L6452_42503 [Arctium lappa]